MVESNQDRFNDKTDPNDVFFSTANLIRQVEELEPAYIADSQIRDRWLAKFAKREPHLSGVINSVTATDKNRGWRVVGGRNQVSRITDMLHNFECAPGLSGWRPALSLASESFWTTDMGAVIELGKEGRDGPTRALYNVDPTRCSLTGKINFPLKYHPKTGKVQKWRVDDFFRVTSSPSLFEEYSGLGNCALSRCVQLAQLMVAIYRHDEEKLLSKAPRGLLLLSGIKQQQFKDAMAAKNAEDESTGTKYFGSVAVLASAATSVDAKLLALSELPDNFNLRDWMDMLMYGYALCFGYDASEFWPVQYGALGRGNEVQIQHEKATGKGRLDFVLGFQEQLQNYLPESIQFEFDQRDEQGDLIHASVNQAWVNVVKSAYATSAGGLPMISNQEARILLADYGIIPSSWAETETTHSTDLDERDNEEESPDGNNQGESPDVEDEPTETNPVSASPSANLRPSFRTKQMDALKEELLERSSVHLAAERFPKEPIVQYSYPANTTITLWDRGEDIYVKRIFAVKKIVQNSVAPKIEETPKPMPEVANNGRQFVFNIPETKLPTIHVDAPPAPVVNITMPNLPPANVTVHVPQQKAPVVNFPKQEATKVTVTVPAPVVNFKAPEQRQADPVINFNPTINVPAPEVNITNEVNIPETQEEITVERGTDGKITKMIKKFLKRRN